MRRRYLVIPAEFTDTWADILDYAAERGVWGNVFIGCREFRASTGALVFKFDV